MFYSNNLLSKNKHLFWIFLAGALSLGLSCTGSKKISYKPLSNSLLWKIEGKELREPSYLFGTMHLIPAEDYLWTTAMNNAFSQSKQVVFELDMNEMNDMSNMLTLLPQLFMKGDTTLSMLLNRDDYDELTAKMQNIGLPMFLFERMKPFFLSVFLSEDMKPGALQDGDKIKSYELELTTMANAQRKKVSGLESIAFQAGLFDNIPYKQQAEMLSEILRQSETNKADSLQSQELIKWYKQQNIQKLNETITQEKSEFSGMEESLLYLRNEQWIGLMEKNMKEGATFFAVGAGHLPGERGVIHLLRKAGYQVKPVKK
jgi:uncharacterized protein